jgi:hypothetical protein
MRWSVCRFIKNIFVRTIDPLVAPRASIAPLARRSALILRTLGSENTQIPRLPFY